MPTSNLHKRLDRIERAVTLLELRRSRELTTAEAAELKALVLEKTAVELVDELPAIRLPHLEVRARRVIRDLCGTPVDEL